MSSAFVVTSPPVVEPITLEQAKAYLRVDFFDDDTVISGLISRARAYAETVTHRALATQTIQQVDTIARPQGGDLSGSLLEGPNWYQFQEQLGANPFGPAQFYFDLAMPPIQAGAGITIEYRVTAFEPWQTFPQITNADGSTNTYLDTAQEPARLYLMTPVTANFYRFTYTAGYTTGYPVPPDILQPLYEMVAYLYNNREADVFPQDTINKLLARRVEWV